MPFTKAQSVLKRVLPEPLFDRLYQVATAGYYARQGVADWIYYHTPRIDINKWTERTLTSYVRPYTMVGRSGLILTYNLVRRTEEQNLSGCLVECGVARGGCAALMLMTSWASHPTNFLLINDDDYVDEFIRETWLFDSFKGLPEPTAEDGELRKPRGKDRGSWDLAKGYCLGTQEEVEELLFDKLNLSREKVHLVKGWFQDTLPEYRERVGDIAVLRIDGDWYESTKCCLVNLYEQVVDGGYVILDDYALVGCRKAVDEFFAGKPYPQITLDGRGGGWFRKQNTIATNKRLPR